MKIFKPCLLTVFSAIVLMLFLGGCGEQPKSEAEKTGAPEVEIEIEKKADVSAKDVKKETGEALEAAKVYALQQKEEYQKKMEVKLKELVTQIDKMKAEAKDSTAEAKAGFEKRIQEMETRREAAGKKLDEIKKSSAEAWQNLKSDLDGIMSDLEKKLKEIFPPFE